MGKFNSELIERDFVYREKWNEQEKCPHYTRRERRVIVCLCGSTRFMAEFYDANMRETLAGKIVLTVGMSSHGDCQPTEQEKIGLDELHFDKIDLADEVLILNVGGYVGHSTRREVMHARRRGKTIRWLEPSSVPVDLLNMPPTPRND